MFPPKTSLSWIHSARALLSLFILCFSSALSSSLKLHLRNFYVTISEISDPSPSPKFLTRFTLTHLHRWRFTLTHSLIHPHPHLTQSPIHPHPFTLTDSSLPISIAEALPSPIHWFTLTHSQGFLGLGSDFAKTKLRRCWGIQLRRCWC